MPKTIYTKQNKKKQVNYRKIWIDAHGPISVDWEGCNYHIHHIDGNHENNHIDNLACISIQEHYYIHLSQDDYGACLWLSAHMKLSPKEKSELARLNANKRVENGTHNLLKRPDGSSITSDNVKNGTHNSQITHSCPKCGKNGKGSQMYLNHFDNCGKNSKKCKTWEVTFPDGHTETITNMNKFCQLHNLDSGNMYNVAKGKLKQYKGFKVRKLSNF